MPKLPGGFTAKVDSGGASGGRRATAEDFHSGDLTAGAHAVGKVAEGFLDRREEDDSRQVLIRQAEIRAKYAKRLDEAATNGEDVSKIREELDGDLAGVDANVSTKKGLDTARLHAATTGSMFDNQANNILVSRAVTQARVDGNKFLNSTGAIVASNPAYLPQAEKDVDDFVSTLGRVPPEKRQEIAESLKQNMNVAAAMANARLDPEGTKRAVEGGAYNMMPEQRLQVIHQADATLRAKRADDQYVRAEKEYQERERNEAAYDKQFKAIMAGTTTAKAILADPNLKPNTREHLITFMEHRAKALAGGDRKSDPRVVKDLWMAINAPDGDPRKVYNADAIFEAVQKGGLNTSDADRLMGQVANQKDANNRSFGVRLNGRIQTVTQAMRSSPQYSAQPELAAAIQLEMITQVERKAEQMRRDNKPPDDLLNPESKDYFFKPNVIKTIADDVRQQNQAALPKISSKAELDALPVGTQYVGPDGAVATRTAAKKPAALPENDMQAWMAATGGALKPGQTQAQAIADWKKARK